MADILKPRDAKDVEEAVRWAIDTTRRSKWPGRAPSARIGRPSQTDITLDLSGLTGVTLYEPDELVLSARAGTPMAEIEALVADTTRSWRSSRPTTARCWAVSRRRHDRRRASPPISPARAASRRAPRATISSVSARSSGRGETFKSGGRVVKNVTGYDLCKLMAGSCGTLAAMTDITIKVLPRRRPRRPSSSRASTMRAPRRHGGRHGLVLRRVGRRASARPRRGAGRRACPAEASTAAAAGRCRAFGRRIATETLAALLAPFGAVEILDGRASRDLWRRCPRCSRRSRRRASARSGAFPCRPRAAHELAAAITPAAQMFYDWAGGLIWVAMPPSDEPDAGAVRGAVAAIGGHATLIRAPAAVRAARRRCSSRSAERIAALNKRVKDSFDPKGVLNPGRMWAGV